MSWTRDGLERLGGGPDGMTVVSATEEALGDVVATVIPLIALALTGSLLLAGAGIAGAALVAVLAMRTRRAPSALGTPRLAGGSLVSPSGAAVRLVREAVEGLMLASSPVLIGLVFGDTALHTTAAIVVALAGGTLVAASRELVACRRFEREQRVDLLEVGLHGETQLVGVAR